MSCQTFAGHAVLFLPIVALVLFLGLAPHITAIQQSPPRTIYSGGLFVLSDVPTYYAKMRAGYDGNILYQNKFTTERPNPPVPIHLFYVWLGHLARIMSIGVMDMFFYARFFFGFVFLFTLYVFLNLFFQKRVAFLSFFFCCFASGLGWMFLDTTIPSQYLIDLFLPAFAPLARFSTIPHVLFSHTLFLVSIGGVLGYMRWKHTQALFLTAAAFFFANFVLPYHSILLYILMAIFLVLGAKRELFSQKDARAVLYALLPSLFSLLFMLGVVAYNPLWGVAQQESEIFFVSPAGILIGFGVLGISAAFGVFFVRKKLFQDTVLFFFFLFLIIPLVLSYIPIVPQYRRFLEVPLFVPITVFSALFFLLLYDFSRRRFPFIFHTALAVIVAVLFFALALPSSAVFYSRTNSSIMSELKDIVYIRTDVIDALQWLDKNVSSDAIILSHPIIGMVTPFFANRFTFVGHWSETVRFSEKIQMFESLYRAKLSSQEAREFFFRQKIQYIITSPLDKAYSNKLPTSYEAVLEKVYESGEVVIYKVVL